MIPIWVWLVLLLTGALLALFWWRTRNREPVKCLLLGLDNAGKTTLIHLLRIDGERIHAPGRRLPLSLNVGGRELILFDALTSHWGGQDMALREYGLTVRAFVFVVDCADHNRLEEAATLFKALMESPYKWPVLVFGNKIDVVNAISFARLVEVLGLWNPKREAAVRAALFGVMLSHRRRGQNLFGRLPRDIALLIAKRVVASYVEWGKRFDIEIPTIMKVNGRSVLVEMSSVLTPVRCQSFNQLLRLV